MTQTQTVRRYRPSDSDRVWTVHERAIRASPLEFYENAPADELLTRIPKSYLETGGEFVVGLVDGTIVSIGGYQPEDEHTCTLKHIRVHPDHQRQGYGKEILEELEERARSDGFRRVSLCTNNRLEAARQLYEANGYRELHRHIHVETGHTFIYYYKQLAD